MGTAMETSVNHSSLEWTWYIKDVHLNHEPRLVATSDFDEEWRGTWIAINSDIFEVGAGTPQHSRWKFSVTKRDDCVTDFLDDEKRPGLALGIHFLGFVEQSGNGASASDQKVKCLVQAMISGPNSSKNKEDKVYDLKKYRDFSVTNLDFYRGFISWPQFCSEHDKIFADHAMKIQIKLTLIGDTVTKTVLDFGQLSQQETQTMENDYGKFYNNPDLSDFTIILSQESADPVQFYAHKFVLAARSPLFRRMLQTPMREESKLTMENMDPQTLTLMLQFIYKGTIEIPDDKLCIFGLLNAAKMYDLKGLSKLIALKLQSLLNDENVGELIVAAYEFARGHDEVISVLRDYCQRRQQILWKNPEYKKLFLQNPAAFMGE